MQTTPTVDGITDNAWDALCELFGRADIVFCAALAFADDQQHGLRLLARHFFINPDA